MRVKLSRNMVELQDIVVYDCYCLWDLFLENIADCGVNSDAFQKAVDACPNRAALRKLVCEFI